MIALCPFQNTGAWYRLQWTSTQSQTHLFCWGQGGDPNQVNAFWKSSMASWMLNSWSRGAPWFSALSAKVLKSFQMPNDDWLFLFQQCLRLGEDSVELSKVRPLFWQLWIPFWINLLPGALFGPLCGGKEHARHCASVHKECIEYRGGIRRLWQWPINFLAPFSEGECSDDKLALAQK